MILIFVVISIGAAFTGLYYLTTAVKAPHVYALAEAVGAAFLCLIISTLAAAASFVGK
jgi:hypothetical protein